MKINKLHEGFDFTDKSRKKYDQDLCGIIKYGLDQLYAISKTPNKSRISVLVRILEPLISNLSEITIDRQPDEKFEIDAIINDGTMLLSHLRAHKDGPISPEVNNLLENFIDAIKTYLITNIKEE